MNEDDLPGIPAVPAALTELIRRRQATARYLRKMAESVEGGAIQAFDIAWSQNMPGPPAGQILIDSTQLVVPQTAPKVRVVKAEREPTPAPEESAITKHEAVPVFDVSDVEGSEDDEKCDAEECATCSPDTDPDLSSKN